ncbi:MAG: T9SS type A sorting domain-containing protein [Bacteroidota bacterium]
MKNSTLRFWALISILLTATISKGQPVPFTFNWNDKYQNTFSNGYSNEGRKVVVNPANGFIYVLADVTSDLDPGGAANGQTNSYSVVLQYEPSGSLLNSQIIDVGVHTVSGFDRSSGYGLELDASGNVYVGYNNSDSTTSFNVNISKFTANLASVWTYTFNPTSSDYGVDMKVNSTGTAYALVKSIGTGGAVRYRIIRASAAGSATTTFYNFTINPDYFTTMALDASSNIYLAGYRQSTVAGSAKLITVASVLGTGSLGALRWSQLDDCGTVTGDDIAKHITIGADGNVYITGSSVGSAQHGLDAVTMKFSSVNGKKLWENFINYTLNDGAFLVSVPDINTVNVAWSSGSVVYLEQISPSTGLFVRRAAYTPTPASPYTSIGAATISGLASSAGRNVYMTGTIAANDAGFNFDAGWLVKFNFSSRGGTRIENVAPIEGTSNQSKRSVGMALDNANTSIYWIRDIAETHANHQQEKIEISSMEGTGSFRMGQDLNEQIAKNRIWFENPVSESITINSVDEMIEIQILDITGKTIKKINQISNNQPIELKQLPTGIYNLLVVHNDGFTTYKQFIKQ